MGLKSLSAQWPLLLLPVFFLLNASNEFLGDLDFQFYVRMGGYLLILVITAAVASAIFLKNREQILSFSFIVLVYLVFTKNMYKLSEAALNRSAFFLITAVLIMAAFLFIKRGSGYRLKSFNKGITLVLSVLVVYEAGNLLYKSFSGKKLYLELPDAPRLMPWASSSRPNIYLLLFDEYQGNQGLEKLFGFNNSGFHDQLRDHGFHLIGHPKSNYNYTYYSVPSMFAMSYLYYTDSCYDLDFNRVIKSINTLNDRNYFTGYLNSQGYTIRNFSLFDVEGISTPYDFVGLDEDAFAVLFSRTLPGWIKTDLLHVFPGNSIHKLADDLYYQFYRYNRAVLKDTEDVSRERGVGPLFVYSHFLLPHMPVVTDSNGAIRDIRAAAKELHSNSPELKQSYLDYIKYANKICGQLLDSIVLHDPTAAVIVVSDHGLRRLLGSGWVHDIQMAVRMPGIPDPGFYDEMSTVNLLRLVLNGVAGQKMRLLPDSTISVK